MSLSVIKIENLYKEYRLGTIGYGTLREDMESWWAKFRGKPDPNSIMGKGNYHYKRQSERILALNNINLEIKRGERVGIIGKNGAGKTTLLKILSKIASPTKGLVKIKGRIASLIAVGTGFHAELTGRENIYLNGSILGLRKFEIDQRFDEIVDFSGVEQFIDTPVKRYSSGMNVRLGFAVAAHLDPDILLVDEVLAVGDLEFRKKAIGKMRDTKDLIGRTVLFVSHNMHAIESLCDRVILLDRGSIVYDGKVGLGINTYLTQSISPPKSSMELKHDHNNDKLEVKSIQLLSNGKLTSKPSCIENIEIQIDYFNKESRSRRFVSIHLKNAIGSIIFTSANNASASSTYDEHCYQEYDIGLYRTTCTIQNNFLNPGIHSIDLHINERGARDGIIFIKDAYFFEVIEDSSWREEYLDEWIGVVRPKLAWKTVKID